VRWEKLRDKKRMDAVTSVKRLGRWAVDFALPPRCAGCGTIVDEVHSFCAECWKGIEFLGSGGCETCGLPLQGTDIQTCAACLAMPPRISRMRAAVAYDDLTRGLALRLKYGRKVATAKTMARYMAPLIPVDGEERLLVPVPLHRMRLWHRGFNQAAIIAGEISKRTGVEHAPHLLRRTKRTPPLKGMSHLQRRRAVAGAFRVAERASIMGRTIVLVDDVLTSGSTANACARVLKRAGAARVELISWARVVRPTHLMR
jgi:ComF family protein